MPAKSYIDGFIPNGADDAACASCGICLQKCPVMKMGAKESQQEVARLLNDEPTERVLSECTFCFSCNAFCPQGLRPYNLIMERVIAENEKSGASRPKAIDYMMTGKSESGYFFDQYKAAPDADKAILDRWAMAPPKSRDTLFVGCYGRTIPRQLEHAGALKDLPKFGPRDACCGEIAHRFGDYAFFSEQVERTRKALESLNTERLVCYCGSCAHYLGHVWPKDHGVGLPFEVISLYEWLWEKYCAGEIEVKKKFEGTVAISDSCYASELGDGFYDAVRSLNNAVGLQTVELSDNREDSLCCGFACGIRNRYDQSQVALEAKKKLDQVLATGTREVSVNCPGCWVGISTAARAANEKLKVRFAISDFLRAFDG